MVYRFNNIEVNTENYLLTVSGTETPVEPQVFNLIVCLIENSDKIVSREELLDHVWKGRIVSDTSINNCNLSCQVNAIDCRFTAIIDWVCAIYEH